MADGNTDKIRPLKEQTSETGSSATLLPMLIGGLVLIVIGMAVVMILG
jgi:hypothetical protein